MNVMKKRLLWISLVFLGLDGFMTYSLSYGVLTPSQTLVIVNADRKTSVDLGLYYMKQRNIPSQNLVYVNTGNGHRISREDYQKKVLGPILSAIMGDGGRRIRCLVLMDGMPVQVEAPPRPMEEQKRWERLKTEEADLRNRLMNLAKEVESPVRKDLEKKLKDVQRALQGMRRGLESATLDSELALALVPSYPLESWVPNPAYVGAKEKDRWVPPEQVLVVARMSGPSPEAVKKLIEETVQVEREGLKGIAYFDARWPLLENERKKSRSAYAMYDLSIHKAAEMVQKSGRLPVILDTTEGVFQPGKCPSAVLYCGWYSVGKYVDAFDWKPGAVGYHIESTSVWMRNLLKRGVAATLGPIREPYLQAFPLPHIFFALLVQERMTVGEAYMLSVPYLSWQLIFMGDPLYRPFAVEPKKM